MAAETPHVLEFVEFLQMFVSGEDVIDIGHFERKVIQPGPGLSRTR